MSRYIYNVVELISDNRDTLVTTYNVDTAFTERDRLRNVADTYTSYVVEVERESDRRED